MEMIERMRLRDFAAWLVTNLDGIVEIDDDQVNAIFQINTPELLGEKQYGVIYAYEGETLEVNVWEYDGIFYDYDSAWLVLEESNNFGGYGTASQWINGLAQRHKALANRVSAPGT